ncbi:MAG: phospho-sugar mutase [Clostridia bacterium]|nr:phospho-sugar mutase [Clostridia bacterium]
MKKYCVEYERWLGSAAITESEREELISIKDNEELKELRFSSYMDFGTAGLRSTMNMGPGAMNRFTVAHTTRGIAKLVKSSGGRERGVAIAYDSRNNSREFARVSACVLAGAGVKSYIFDGIRPTPELSFAVKKLGTMAGINITASHNPKEYNGYKAYWEDGAQIGPEQATVVSRERESFDVLDTTDIMDYDEAKSKGLIVELNEEFDELYIAAVMESSINPDAIKSVADDLKVVYTPLHGAGYKLVPKIFATMGLKHLYLVDAQMTPNGDFPTVVKPNPEYKEVFTLGIDIANEVGSDLIIATDPDSDRVGVMSRTPDGSFATISGNQMGALLLDYAIKQRREKGMLTDGSYCVKSIVSTDMAYKIATANNVKIHDVLTGFKFIGEVIKNYESCGNTDGFILGFEESYGYLLGSYARDKDAVEASMIILEMTAYYKKRSMTLFDALTALYKEYGYYKEAMIDIYMEGLDGIEKRRRIMSGLRECPPEELGGIKISKIGDYKKATVTSLADGSVVSTGQPESDVLYYTLANEDKIIVRPSGTEPKIKIYVLSHGDTLEEIAEKIKLYERDAKKLTEV